MAAPARRRFGQHFLHDPAVAARILQAIAPRPGEAIVEIGPGRGVLTRSLLAAAGHLDAVEIDRDLAAQLAKDFPPGSGLDLHVGDALTFDFAALAALRGARLRIVGNLPYNISTPLLFHLLETPAAHLDLHVMLQREVIERMAAAPGSKEYGRLTVMLAPWTRVEKLFDVGPGAFQPPPKVWSSVARLTLRATPAFDVPANFAGLVASAFSQRRKTLRNALKTLLSAAEIQAVGVDPGARAEVIPPAGFAALARAAAQR
ncbi:MAG TPA: 16S rRNA (adenine(1518)-N(6)/adenine(1519)-N(6))-dimethyltransferase RsmA [Steroidobacteraceae bacterium]|nr:16S rRNA (adenine(1518)-N(6)/adenine(1519)-N(6))-dimethyltransferase RsmA [Steroidobacteraceae bacterium]HQX46534.1 16S rRNA (adenine(1518)-N(6)/adenine(1519)-N(6))-dimethyltransferase RsmA [Steroidobacteraceae bacterium]HQX78042.1 16S rRNA (adenine(1518)-N(6)/adenine(1519)-N(6))-dimethyltransferase RsmA [Steroidobacteraceae bacterium]